MSQGHKGSRLLLRDQIIAVDFSTAHFDFNEDATGIQYGNMIQPIAGAVYTMRRDGKFGKGIAIEEATTNVMPYPLVQQYAGGSLSAKQSYYTNDGYRIIATSQPLNGPLAGCKIDIISGESFTVSGYSNLSSVKIYHKGWDSANAQVYAQTSTSITPDSNGYFSKTITVTGTNLSYVNIGIGDPALADYWLEEIQVEKKLFATSFVNGSRGAGVLDYGISLPVIEGTFSAWVYVNDVLKDSTDFKHIFSTRTANDRDDGMTMFHDSGSARFRLKSTDDAGTSSYIYVSDSFFPNGWRLMTARWSSTRLSLLVDGVEVGSVTNPALASGYKNQLMIGNEYGIRQANTVIDEIRIDNYVVPDEELLAWAISNKPFYNPYDYRAYAY